MKIGIYFNPKGVEEEIRAGVAVKLGEVDAISLEYITRELQLRGVDVERLLFEPKKWI